MDDGRIHLSAGREDVRRRTPLESFVFAYAALIPLAAGALGYFAAPAEARTLVARLTIAWAAAILCFLAGVRRGLSFRQEGGPLLTQLASMLWLFALGFAALIVPSGPAALILLLAGYATMALYDPVAARAGDAPAYFQRLRPVQMGIAILSLAVLLAGIVTKA